MRDWPSYLSLHATGELARRAADLAAMLASCELCPNLCRVDRTVGRSGRCKTADRPVVSSYNPHFGEEPPLSGYRGSGTIFFTHCTMACRFCQNYPISQLGHGREVSTQELAAMMLDLQRRGCHNINLVTPTHQLPMILEALCIAADGGLALPIVYNTSGYERIEILHLLDGIVDIYLPDMKYADSAVAERYSGVKGYVEANRAALREMWRQVGPLVCDERGVAHRGLIIRHLVLPNGLAGTEDCLKWVARELGPETCVNVMSQYFPAHEAPQIPELARRLRSDEYNEALEALYAAGLSEGYAQDPPNGSPLVFPDGDLLTD